jgi:outer membrane murein-binding lipoprotein Lpp
MRTALTPALACLVLLAAGCADDTRTKDLEAKIARLEAVTTALATQVKNMELQYEIAASDRIAFLKPGDSGYSVLKLDLGNVTVKITDVKPDAAGSRVSLQFGNLTSARIDGLKAKLEWGRVDGSGIAQNDKAKSREVKFTEPLAPGAWTQSELVLEGVPASELGFVRLSEVDHSGIGLLQ